MWPFSACFKRILTLLLLFYAVSAFSAADNYAQSALTSSPNDVIRLLSTLENESESLIPQTELTPAFNKIKKQLEAFNKRTGIQLGMDYIPLYEHAMQSIGKQNAAGNEYYLFGKWRLFKEQTRSPLVGFKLEERFSYTELYPNHLARQFDSIIKTVSGYSPLDPAITELWLQHYLLQDRLAYRIGKVDLDAIMNSYAFDSRRFYFLSDVFSSTPAIDKPTKSLGLIAALKVTEHTYVSAGITNLNGSEGSASFDTLDKGEYIKALEVGFRDKIRNPQADNYHVFLWQSDAQKELGRPSDHGYSVVLQKNLANRFIPFIKININSGKVKDIKELYTSGFGYHYPFNGKFGLLGFAAAYAVLSEPQLGHQIIFESFYRIQLTPYSQLTPDVQLIYTPVPSQWVPVANLRFRVSV